jgi:hypothetical protein
MDVTIGEGAILDPPSNPRLRGSGPIRRVLRLAAKLDCCGTQSSLNGYVFAIAGVRRHSMAASAAITMVTMNSPITIIRSTEPSC